MSTKVFQDKVFPRHVSDLMNVMHMMVFEGTDGEEKWDTYLTLKQKEYIALGLAQYYQCGFCIQYHMTALAKLERIGQPTLTKNVNSMVLFLRIDTRTVGESEQEYWRAAWHNFAQSLSAGSEDQSIPYLMGLAIGIARDDEFLIDLCGKEVTNLLSHKGINVRSAIGELESVVIFMKAAASKNRVVDKVENLFDGGDEVV